MLYSMTKFTLFLWLTGLKTKAIFKLAFKKLKNPVLKRTVAKIATLQQAATVGNVKVEDL